MSFPADKARRICIYLLTISAHLLFFSTSPGYAADNVTAYQVLQEYGFPVGILPKGVTRYELDRGTGKFSVYFDKTCGFTIDGYNIRYQPTVKGVISYQKLSQLSGVQVKILFFWLGIGEVYLDGTQMEFSVGIASAGFAVDSFYESPQCGCGFDCVNGRRGYLGTNDRLSSSSSASA